MLAHVQDLEDDIAAITERIEAATAPFANEVALLASIPGVGPRVAEVILAEIGADMSVFPTDGHLASWAGMCPGQRESAGKPGLGHDPQGLQVAAHRPDRVRPSRRSSQGHLPQRTLPAGMPTPRRQEGDRGGGPRDPPRRLPRPLDR